MNIQPTLTNKSVVIRPMIETDFEDLFQVASDPLIWEQHPCKRYLKSEFEKFFAESMYSKGALTTIDKNSQKIIGSSRYNLIVEIPNVIEIGWTFLNRKYWGGLYNREIKNLMITHAFTYVEKVIFFVAKTNIRSQKAIEKIKGYKVDQSQFKNYPTKHLDNLTYIIKQQFNLSEIEDLEKLR